jgi:UDP-N-acetylmuramoyl-tripeptide--D-alanyl-D-alanine ligase
MKTAFKAPLAFLLAILARAIVKKYKPRIVMVTGSVGKTSTKDAIAAALSTTYHVRASEKSYNSEFGVPLTIIGAKNPWMDAYKWLRVIEEALALILLPSHYPKLLVLEVGADRPGDLARILKIATPDAVVVTRLPDVPVHVEAYASPAAVREEEFTPAHALTKGAPLVYNADDPHTHALAEKLDASLTTFGFAKDSSVRLQTPHVYEEAGQPAGMEAQMHSADVVHALRVPGAIGRPQLYAPAAAFALAKALGVSEAEALAGLTTYASPPGRSRLIAGMHGSIIIDDSYNASPAAVEEALAILSEVPHVRRRIAVIGDMLELGRYSVSEHARIGTTAAGKADMVVGVGVRARALVEAAKAAGLTEEMVRMYDDSFLAAEALKSVVGEGDAVLIKGSQGMRMERIIEALLRNPEDISKLVRQEEEWRKR